MSETATNDTTTAAANANTERPPEQWVKAYGDTLNDGRVQMSFTLPVPLDELSKEGAKQLALSMGLEEPAVVHAEDMGQGFSFFIVYGQCKHRVDLSRLKIPSQNLKCWTRTALMPSSQKR